MKTKPRRARNISREAPVSPDVPVKIRPVSPGDLDGLRGMLARLSPETVYMRFHTPRVPEWAPEYLADVRYHGGFSLIAVVGDRVVGHAMYGKPMDDEAEIAVVVEDGCQAGGIGKLLIYQLVEEAGSRGVELFTCASLGENRRIASLVNAVFTEAEYFVEGGVRFVRMPLRSVRPVGAHRKGENTDE